MDIETGPIQRGSMVRRHTAISASLEELQRPESLCTLGAQDRRVEHAD